MIRFPVEVKERLAAIAARERRTFTAQLLLIIDEWLAMKETRSDDRKAEPPAP
jgi:predicted DNA-binding protein